MSRVVLIIQARMGSSRLPGKVISRISGKPMLWHVIDRCKRCEKVDLVVVATTTKEEDDVVAKLAEESGAAVYRGSESDVLDRYYRAANEHDAEVIGRVTADCPLIDPRLVDRMIEFYEDGGGDYDYVGMGRPNRYPNGLDAEVFSFEALKRAWKEAALRSEREHVTPYIWKNDGLFKIGAVESEQDLSSHRWTVDEERDLMLVREIHKHLYEEGKLIVTEDILDLLSRMPEISRINQGIKRNEGYLKSLKEDSVVDVENDADE